MKRLFILLLISILFISRNFSQNPVPNSGFENWADDNKPESWYGLTIPIPFFPIYTISKTMDAQQGSYAVLIETQDVILLGPVPGIASLAPISINLLGGGITFTNAGAPLYVRPTKVSGYFKYEGVDGDTAMFAGVFTRWNSLQNKRDTLAMTGIMVNTTVTNYTTFQFSVNLTQTPDSMNLIFVSSAGFNPQPGSALYIDNLSMDYTSTAGVESLQLSGGSAFPNPASTEILFAMPEDGPSQVKVYDMSGKAVLSKDMADRQFFVNVRLLNPGIYQIVITQNGRNYVHKASVIR
jgi:hypothetical protein